MPAISVFRTTIFKKKHSLSTRSTPRLNLKARAAIQSQPPLLHFIMLTALLPLLLPLLLLLLRSPAASAQPNRTICSQNATVYGWVQRAFNQSYPGLEAYANSVRAGLPDAACDALNAYYRASPTGAWFRRRLPPPSSRRA